MLLLDFSTPAVALEVAEVWFSSLLKKKKLKKKKKEKQDTVHRWHSRTFWKRLLTLATDQRGLQERPGVAVQTG